MDDKAILDDLVAKIKIRLPDFEIRYKDEDTLQKLIGKALFFNSAYMTRYTTTMFGKVYFTSRKWVEDNPRSAWKVLAHEYVHLLDDKDEGLKFSLSYLAPQIYAAGALLAFGAFWSLWFLLALGFLGFLAPWGSKGRTKWEMRGYTMSMAVNYWRYGSVADWQKLNIVENFTGPNYYYMCRDRAAMDSKVHVAELLIMKGEAAKKTHPLVVQDMLSVLRAHDALHAGVRTGEDNVA